MMKVHQASKSANSSANSQLFLGLDEQRSVFDQLWTLKTAVDTPEPPQHRSICAKSSAEYMERSSGKHHPDPSIGGLDSRLDMNQLYQESMGIWVYLLHAGSRLFPPFPPQNMSKC